MKQVRTEAERVFGEDFSERIVKADCTYRFDFYFPDEAIVVEIALSLRNPQSEYEKDLFKCVLAQEAGLRISDLVLITKPGGSQRLRAPGPAAIAELANRRFGIRISVVELGRDDDGPQSNRDAI